MAFLRTKFAKKPEIAEANIAAFQAGWNFGETTEDFAVSYEVTPARDVPPGTYRNITGNLALSYGLIAAAQQRRAAAVPRRVPDHAGLRHPARAVQAQALRRAHLPGRGRDRRHRRGARRGVRRRARRHHDLRPGHRAQARDDRPGGLAGAAAADRRHPARRPVDRAADQDRAGRPAAGDVRPQRRGAGADRRAALPGGLLRRRDRGGPDRADVPHAGVPALRRLPRQRLRAVADPRRRRPARPARCEFATEPERHRRRHEGSSCPTCATRRRWPARGPCPAPRASSTASAASRRPTAPATSPTTRPTTTSWSAPGRPRSTASPRRPAAGGRRPDRRRRASWCSAGARRTARSAPRCRRVRAGRRARSPRPTCATSTRSRPTSARCSRRYDKVVVPEMNLGQLATAAPGASTSSTRIGYNQVTRPAVQGRAELAERHCKEVIDMPEVDTTARSTLVPKADGAADHEGLQDRPGGALVPRLR